MEENKNVFSSLLATKEHARELASTHDVGHFIRELDHNKVFEPAPSGSGRLSAAERASHIEQGNFEFEIELSNQLLAFFLHEECERHARFMLRFVTDQQDWNAYYGLTINLCKSLKELGRYSDAQTIATDTIRQAQDFGQTMWVIRFTLLLGSLLIINGEYLDALSVLDQSYVIATGLGAHHYAAESLQNLSSVLHALGFVSLGVECLSRAMKMLGLSGDSPINTANTVLTLVRLMVESGANSEALNLLRQLEQECRGKDEYINIHRHLLLTIANINILEGQLEQAEQHLHEVTKLSSRHADPSARTYFNLLANEIEYRAYGRKKQVIREDVMSMVTLDPHHLGYPFALIQSARIFENNGHPLEAIALIQKTLEDRSTTLWPRSRMLLLEAISEIAFRNKEFQIAFKAETEIGNTISEAFHSQVSRGLSSVSALNNLSFMKLLVNPSDDLERTFNERFERQRHHLSDMAVRLFKTSKIREEIQSGMRLVSSDLGDAYRQLSTILDRIRFEDTFEAEWSRLQTILSHVKPGFMSKLYGLPISLSPSEVRICSLLVLGLSNNEIAKLLRVSKRNVETHRYHVRRKFQLETGIDLVTYLKSLDTT